MAPTLLCYRSMKNKPETTGTPNGDSLFITTAFLFLALTMAWGATYQPHTEEVAVMVSPVEQNEAIENEPTQPIQPVVAVQQAPVKVTLEGGLSGDVAKASWVY